MRQLLITIGCNKKTFRDHITLDDLFVAKFMLAIDRRLQHYFGMCEHVTVSRIKARYVPDMAVQTMHRDLCYATKYGSDSGYIRR